MVVKKRMNLIRLSDERIENLTRSASQLTGSVMHKL